jgi:hypothetical protein
VTGSAEGLTATVFVLAGGGLAVGTVYGPDGTLMNRKHGEIMNRHNLAAMGGITLGAEAGPGGSGAAGAGPSAGRVTVAFDPLCPVAGRLMASPAVLELLRAGVEVVWAPVNILPGSLGHGEFFLREGRLPVTALEAAPDSRFWERADGAALAGGGPIPEGEWFGPSAVIENTWRFRSMMGRGAEPLSPVLMWLEGGELVTRTGVPLPGEIDPARVDPPGPPDPPVQGSGTGGGRNGDFGEVSLGGERRRFVGHAGPGGTKVREVPGVRKVPSLQGFLEHPGVTEVPEKQSASEAQKAPSVPGDRDVHDVSAVPDAARDMGDQRVGCGSGGECVHAAKRIGKRSGSGRVRLLKGAAIRKAAEAAARPSGNPRDGAEDAVAALSVTVGGVPGRVSDSSGFPLSVFTTGELRDGRDVPAGLPADADAAPVLSGGAASAGDGEIPLMFPDGEDGGGPGSPVPARMSSGAEPSGLLFAESSGLQSAGSSGVSSSGLNADRSDDERTSEGLSEMDRAERQILEATGLGAAEGGAVAEVLARMKKAAPPEAVSGGFFGKYPVFGAGDAPGGLAPMDGRDAAVSRLYRNVPPEADVGFSRRVPDCFLFAPGPTDAVVTADPERVGGVSRTMPGPAGYPTLSAARDPVPEPGVRPGSGRLEVTLPAPGVIAGADGGVVSGNRTGGPVAGFGCGSLHVDDHGRTAGHGGRRGGSE